MTDEDLAPALKERMTRTADGIVASPEILDDVRGKYARRRRHQVWAMVCAVVIAAAAIIIPITLTGGRDDTPTVPVPAHKSEPAWARRCFELQERTNGAHLLPAPQFVGMTVGQAWRHLDSEKPADTIGAISAWNGKCTTQDVGTPQKELFLAVVGPGGGPVIRVPDKGDRVVAARISKP